jgi:hypothetical protein
LKRVNVAVAVAEDALGRLQEIAAMCRALGFDHEWTLINVGVLTGSFDIDGLARLRAVPGVVAVEVARAVRPVRLRATAYENSLMGRRAARRAN